MSEPTRTATADSTARTRLISAGAVMAAGTLLSRVMGFGRFMLLVFLFGNGTRQADMFTLANTVPNSMYILVAGGVLNTVLVPQIVRHVKKDSDGGEAYTNRIMTGGLLALFGITLVLTLAVPYVIALYSAGGWKDPALTAQYQSMVALAYYCMPQIFFYGAYVLAGQILNARDRFGPMMWAPIANNVVGIIVLIIFWVVFGQTDTAASFTPGQEALLGIGSTLGIAVQAAVLVPYLRAVGHRFHPRFDFRHTGLGHTVRLAKWTLGFVLVTQAALVVVNKVATAATIDGAGGGLATYNNAWVIWILPHSLITVSLATAMLPSASRLAAAGDLTGVADETTRTMRLAITGLLPTAVAFAVLAVPITRLIFGFGAGSRDADFVAWALMALAIGLVPFTVQYICLRAFYALENTRTPFFLQVIISTANVLLGVSTVLLVDSNPLVAACLALGFSLAYVLGVIISFRRLRRDLPRMAAAPLLRLAARVLAAVAPAAVVAWLICWWFGRWSDSQPARALALAVAGVVAVGLFLVAARLLGVVEVGEIVSTVARRGRSDGGPDDPQPPTGGVDDLGTPGDSNRSWPDASPSIREAAPAEPTPSVGPTENAVPMVTFAGATRTTELAPPAEALTPHPAAGALSRPQTAAGTVLGDRYRLTELLAESPPTVTWRAFDEVLSRSVLVHLFPPQDPVALDLLQVARQAAVATDSRFLRVLDAVYSDDEEIGSYVVCEYATGRSLEVLLSHGPLSALESAWLVREVADALSGVHSFGLFHQRINPDTVILTPDGHVKIVGLLIEEALRPAVGEPARPGVQDPEQVDVGDLGRLLYACLVSRWPGGPAFSLPAAPQTNHHHWMTPRQVRAGVSPALDNVCDQILGDPPRHRAPRLETANDVVNALTKVLGTVDASADLERRLRQPIPKVAATPPAAPPPQSADPAALAPAGATGPGQVLAGSGHGPTGAPATLLREPPPPQAPTRTARPTARPPRRWIALVALMGLLLLGTGVGSAIVLNQREGAAPLPGQRTTGPSAGQPSATAPAGPHKIVAGLDFDPEGDPPNDENGEQVRFAFDGNAKTRWRTVRYIGDPKLGGIKRGVGVIVDLGRAREVSVVEVALSGKGTALEARVPRSKPERTSKPPTRSDNQWRTVSKQSNAGATAQLGLDKPVTTRFVLVYLTSLPKEGSGYRGGIYEVEVS